MFDSSHLNRARKHLNNLLVWHLERGSDSKFKWMWTNIHNITLTLSKPYINTHTAASRPFDALNLSGHIYMSMTAKSNQQTLWNQFLRSEKQTFIKIITTHIYFRTDIPWYRTDVKKCFLFKYYQTVHTSFSAIIIKFTQSN